VPANLPSTQKCPLGVFRNGLARKNNTPMMKPPTSQ
jgi:hypothetical protein